MGFLTIVLLLLIVGVEALSPLLNCETHADSSEQVA